MREKPEKLRQFIGNSAAAQEESVGRQFVYDDISRIQKSVMLHKDIIMLIKQEALRRTLARGIRVTESDLYEEGAKMLLQSLGIKS